LFLGGGGAGGGTLIGGLGYATNAGTGATGGGPAAYALFYFCSSHYLISLSYFSFSAFSFANLSYLSFSSLAALASLSCFSFKH